MLFDINGQERRTLLALVAVPNVFVTAIGPVVAPLGTLALTCESDIPEIEVARVPLKLIPVVPVKFVPVSVTVVPVGPFVGVKEVIVGVAVDSTVNGVPLAL